MKKKNYIINVRDTIREIPIDTSPELDDLLWFGIAYVYTDYRGKKVFWVDKEIATSESIKDYLQAHGVV